MPHLVGEREALGAWPLLIGNANQLGLPIEEAAKLVVASTRARAVEPAFLNLISQVSSGDPWITHIQRRDLLAGPVAALPVPQLNLKAACGFLDENKVNDSFCMRDPSVGQAAVKR